LPDRAGHVSAGNGCIALGPPAGALTQEEGSEILSRTILAWEQLVQQFWPDCYRQCPRARQHVVLSGSRTTREGLKVSYHVIFPWLSFSCNEGDLRHLVKALGRLESLQYSTKQGESVPFLECGVYSRNRVFRMALSCKLSDTSYSPSVYRGADGSLVVTLMHHTSGTAGLRATSAMAWRWAP